jgi:hypothetical protein
MHIGPVWIEADGYHTKYLALTSVTGYRLDGILSSGALPKFWSLQTDIRPRAGETRAGMVSNQTAP